MSEWKFTKRSLRANGDFMVDRAVLDPDSYNRSRHRVFLRVGSLLNQHSTGSHFPIHRPRIAAAAGDSICRRRCWGFRLRSKHPFPASTAVSPSPGFQNSRIEPKTARSRPTRSDTRGLQHPVRAASNSSIT